MASTISLQRTIGLAQQFIRLAPLTFSGIGGISIGNAAGSGYAVNDAVYIPSGLGGIATVSSISGGGATGPVTGLLLNSGGQGYFSALVNSPTTSSGAGVGLTVTTTTTNNDPAFSNADWVKQTILAPPFAWRWNRTTASPQVPTFSTQIGVTDYKVPLANFGWIEKATCYDPDNGYSATELQVGLVIAGETLPNQPTRIAAVLDDASGNITFRLFPAPDKVYAVVVESQNAAQLFTSAAQTWTPIPDYLSYLFNQGFLGKGYEYMSDPRFGPAIQLFYTQLADVAEGLTESQKNLWLGDKLASMRQTMAVQQGKSR
jgi:hypothetical protein